MATPEQNAAFLNQLFQQPVQQYADQSNTRLGALLKMAIANREDQTRREIAAQQSSREDARFKYSTDLETQREKAAADRQTTAITEAQRHETSVAKERERTDIANEFDKLYPQYAAAAARAGLPIKARDEYETSRAGVGQLAADFQTAQVGYDQSQKKAAAKALLMQRDQAMKEADDLQARLTELSKPSAEDQKMARSNAVNAVKQKIEQGGIESAKSLQKAAITKGLAALAKGDDALGTKLLGDEAKGEFDSAYQQTLFQLPNSKARLQEHQQTQQQFLAAQRNVSVIDTDLRKAAALNPYLADELGKTASPLQKLMSGQSAGATSSFDALFPKPAVAPGAPAEQPVAAPTSSGLGLKSLLGIAAAPMMAMPIASNAAAGYGLSKLFSGSPAPAAPSGSPDFSGDYSRPSSVDPMNPTGIPHGPEPEPTWAETFGKQPEAQYLQQLLKKFGVGTP